MQAEGLPAPVPPGLFCRKKRGRDRKGSGLCSGKTDRPESRYAGAKKARKGGKGGKGGKGKERREKAGKAAGRCPGPRRGQGPRAPEKACGGDNPPRAPLVPPYGGAARRLKACRRGQAVRVALSKGKRRGSQRAGWRFFFGVLVGRARSLARFARRRRGAHAVWACPSDPPTVADICSGLRRTRCVSGRDGEMFFGGANVRR